MTSSLRYVSHDGWTGWTQGSLLELDVRDKIPSTFDTLCEKDIACGCNGDNIGVIAERFEGDRVVYLAG